MEGAASWVRGSSALVLLQEGEPLLVIGTHPITPGISFLERSLKSKVRPAVRSGLGLPTHLHDLGARLLWVNARPKRSRTHEHEGHLSRGFLRNKTSPRWKAWYAMSEEERRAKDVEGLAALKAWDESHQDAIVYEGGPLGPTKRTSRDGVADIVNELTVFVVVRASSHEEAAKMFEGHPQPPTPHRSRCSCWQPSSLGPTGAGPSGACASLRTRPSSLWELRPFRYCTARDTDRLGGIDSSRCTWSRLIDPA
jgi:hypothetical protein